VFDAVYSSSFRRKEKNKTRKEPEGNRVISSFLSSVPSGLRGEEKKRNEKISCPNRTAGLWISRIVLGKGLG
jgi:hypothetical protein